MSFLEPRKEQPLALHLARMIGCREALFPASFGFLKERCPKQSGSSEIASGAGLAGFGWPSWPSVVSGIGVHDPMDWWPQNQLEKGVGNQVLHRIDGGPIIGWGPAGTRKRWKDGGFHMEQMPRSIISQLPRLTPVDKMLDGVEARSDLRFFFASEPSFSPSLFTPRRHRH